MPKVFADSSRILVVKDSSVIPSIAILDGDKDAFGDHLIMNFNNNRNEDYTINKSFANSFIFTTFGPNPVVITVTGYHVASQDIDNEKDPVVTSNANDSDPEIYYGNHNITSKNRKLLKIITGFQYQGTTNHGETSIRTEAGCVYMGYMVNFKKHPMNAEKNAGYGYDITFVCRSSWEVTEGKQ